MSQVNLLEKYQNDPELSRLKETLMLGNNYVVWSLNREFRYLLHIIAKAYQLPSMSYINRSDGKVKVRCIVSNNPCYLCQHGHCNEPGICRYCKSKHWTCNNFLVITPNQMAMDHFIETLKNSQGTNHNVVKGIRNDKAKKFIIEADFNSNVKLILPLTIGTWPLSYYCRTGPSDSFMGKIFNSFEWVIHR